MYIALFLDLYVVRLMWTIGFSFQDYKPSVWLVVIFDRSHNGQSGHDHNHHYDDLDYNWSTI